MFLCFLENVVRPFQKKTYRTESYFILSFHRFFFLYNKSRSRLDISLIGFFSISVYLRNETKLF